MDEQLKQKWIKALRSGRYKQTTNTLRAIDQKGEPTGYCCLGVLCAISRKGTFSGGGQPINSYSAIAKTPTSIFKLAKKYTGDVLEVVRNHDLEGMESIFGLEQDDCEKLMSLNDTDQKNFDEIAEWIEKNV